MPFQNGNIVIPVYGNDELSQVKDGLNNGEVFSLSIWSNKNNSEHQIAAVLNKEVSVFEKDDIVYASLLEFNLEQNNISSVSLFPNPTDHRTELQATIKEDAQLETSIFNLLHSINIEFTWAVFFWSKDFRRNFLVFHRWF